MTDSIEIIGLGALNIDHIYKVESILEDGEAVIDKAKSYPGGSAANTIYGLARLGVKTGFIGMVGDDAEGKTLVQDFSKVGVDTSQIRVKPGVKTGSVLCLSDRQGRRSLYVVPGANSLLTEDNIDPAYINQARLLHLSSLADDKQFKMLSQLIARSGLTARLSFAPGALYTTRGLEALSPILSKTYVLFVNQDEMQQLTGKGAIAGAEVCLNQGCHLVVVTLGRGARLELGKKKVMMVGYIRDAENEYPVEPVSPEKGIQVDTTGAGDTFAAGFLYGLLKEKGLKECGHLGAILAQLCISKTGARQGLPNSSELTRYYRQLYSKQL